MAASKARRPLLIAGHTSGVGKTTIATGIMGALSGKGLKVAPFKVGPDYIDPGYHLLASGRRSRNLDTWLTSPATVRSIYRRASRGADISVVEGVMGLFDGRAGGGREGSTAEVASLVGAAVVLVVDCARMGRSLAPLLYGFDRFDPATRVDGVILNNVGTPSHGRILKEAAAEAGVAVLGEIPRRPEMQLDSRHLGLVPTAESSGAQDSVVAMAEAVAANIDLEMLEELAAEPAGIASVATEESEPEPGNDCRPAVRIACALDDAFSFYYIDGLEALEAEGAQIVPFSPIADDTLPECDGIYLGGGFPEMFAPSLAENSGMRRAVAAAAAAGVPVYAECGGMVYLCRGLEIEGKRYEMSGALEMEARMTGRRQALGYVEARARRGSILMPEGVRARGHEFHWSAVKWPPERLAYDCFSARRPAMEQEGFCHANVLASYVHLHFAGEHGAAQNFVSSCRAAAAGRPLLSLPRGGKQNL